MISRLSRQAIESGREHPFVAALVRELEGRLTELTNHLAGSAAAGGYAPDLYQLGGRVQELRLVLRLIRETDGANDE